MSRLSLEFTAQEKSIEIFEKMQQNIGKVPNIYKLMGHSPNVLEGYLGFNEALKKGSLSGAEREQIALAVAGFNQCEYCASAHTMLAQKEGVSQKETKQNLQGKSETPKIQHLIEFCLAILQTKGFVSDDAIKKIKKVGYSDEQVVEIIANVCTNIFTNYFNHVVETEIDFPKVSLD